MSTLLDLIKNQLEDSHYQSLGQQIGASPDETKSAVGEALPVLLGALSSKASGNTGMNFLTSMLDKNHDGSALDDILGMVTGGRAAPQGQAAVQSILGNEVGAAENHIAQNSGLDASTVAKLLPLLAPLVMGALTKAQTAQNLDGQGLHSFLEKESTSIAQSHPQANGFLSSMLDKNRDGSVVDDVLQMGMGAVGNLFRK